jgi:hypothetical protein
VSESKQSLVLLRTILENLAQPEKLNDHPWVNSPIVDDACEQNPSLSALAPGERLVHTINNLFRLTMPNTPPRRGLRLDSHWGEFGILASQYFAPLEFNLPFPPSLKEAWQDIDRAILLYVFNNNKDISEEDCIKYQLIGKEPEVAPNSTISDWHRKGVEQFSDFIVHYMQQSEINSRIRKSEHNKDPRFIKFLKGLLPPRIFWVWFRRIVIILLLALIAFGIFKGYGLYQRVISLKTQAEEMIVIYRTPGETDKFGEISRKASQFRFDLESLQKDIAPLLGYTQYLGRIPKYGGDITQAPYLMEMAVQMTITGDEVLRAVSPLLSENAGEDPAVGILDQISKLKDADTELLAAQVAFANVLAARQMIQTDVLSPQINHLIIDEFDPLVASINTAFPVSDILQMARLAPRLLGAVENGKQTYMILIQNEDELRPTGGFLTAVGVLEVENGKVMSLSFESSDMVDDLGKPYPKAPWQLNDYMMAQILLFRDSNWFTDFPKTVEWAKFLYAYTGSKQVDGVITVDQHVVEELLKIVGPVNVVGVDEPISAQNVLTFMRTSKVNTPPAGVSRQEWDRKQFISWLADPLIHKLLSVDSENWRPFSQVLIQLLDEKHILLQFNDPEMSALIAKRGWDGAVRPEPNSDFLMVVDSNVGFNKTNALTQTEIDYSVNLANPNHPTGNLTITLTNNSQKDPGTNKECFQNGQDIRDLPLDQRKYILNDCYWTYLRIYSPAESRLLSSTPHEIPQYWSLREKMIPAQTDILDENIAGTQAFGTLVVVPEGQTLQTSFTYQLPVMVVTTATDGKTSTYRLKIMKQPGTLAVPLTFHLVLPPGMTITNAPPGLTQVQQSPDEWILKTSLQVDETIEISYLPVQ